MKIAAPVGSRYLTAGVPYMLLVILIGIERWMKSSPKAANFFKWGLVIAFAAFTLKNVPEENTIFRLQSDLKNAATVSEDKFTGADALQCLDPQCCGENCNGYGRV